MTLLVPFDGSPLAEAALVRATAFATVFDEDVLAVTVVPSGNARYARERGWLDPDAEFDRETIRSTLRGQVRELSPEASFRTELVGRHSPSGAIAKHVRRVAREVGASMVFVGSDNAGQMVTGVGSVGGGITADDDYDVVIVRHRRPVDIPALAEGTSKSLVETDVVDE